MMISNRAKRRILLTLLLLLLGSGLIAWFAASHLMAPRPSSVGALPIGHNGQTIELASGSGATVKGWHLVAKKPKGVVVLLHPHGGNRRAMLGRAKFLLDEGYSIVAIDFQGQGETQGEQITFGHLEKHDAKAAVEFARQQYRGQPIAVIGASLGGASALLSSPLKIDALILEAVYSDIREAVHNRVNMHLGALSYLPAQLLLLQVGPRLGVEPKDLRPIDSIALAGCPVFVIGGDSDKRTPASETQKMFDAAQEPKSMWLVKDAGHVDFRSFGPEEYDRRVLGFLRRHMK